METKIINIGRAQVTSTGSKTYPINIIAKGETFTIWRNEKLLTLDLENNYDDISASNFTRADFAGGTITGNITLEREGTPFKYMDGDKEIEDVRKTNVAIVDGFLSIIKSNQAAQNEAYGKELAKFAGVPNN